MREIRFRAWDKFNAHYYYSDHCANLAKFFEAVQDSIDGGNEVILEQFTGLKDKNGKEIYEGDVIKIHTGALTILPNSPTFHKGIIVWNEGVCAFQYSYDAIAGRLTNTLYEFEGVKYEIIGNIYENDELIKNL